MRRLLRALAEGTPEPDEGKEKDKLPLYPAIAKFANVELETLKACASASRPNLPGPDLLRGVAKYAEEHAVRLRVLAHELRRAAAKAERQAGK